MRACTAINHKVTGLPWAGHGWLAITRQMWGQVRRSAGSRISRASVVMRRGTRGGLSVIRAICAGRGSRADRRGMLVIAFEQQHRDVSASFSRRSLQWPAAARPLRPRRRRSEPAVRTSNCGRAPARCRSTTPPATPRRCNCAIRWRLPRRRANAAKVGRQSGDARRRSGPHRAGSRRRFRLASTFRFAMPSSKKACSPKTVCTKLDPVPVTIGEGPAERQLHAYRGSDLGADAVRPPCSNAM